MKLINHVLLVTKEFHSDFQKNTGGTGIFYKNFTDALNERNICVSVFGSSKKPYSMKHDKLSVFFVKDYFQKYKFMELLRSITGKISFLENIHFKICDLEFKYLEKELAKFINNKKIDIIETHDWEGISSIAENLNIPYIIRCHGSWSILHDFFGYGAAKGKIYHEKEAFKNANHIITVSQNNEEMVRHIFGNKNYHLIYNGIDTDIFKPQKDAPILEKSIFYLGNVSLEKGAETALNAFIKVNQTKQDATLHFIGKDTSLANDLKKKISQNKLERKVYFHGKKSRDEVIKLISQAEVVIFPSKGETFGLALTEVMALEKPVVCSNLKAFKEIVSNGENGLIAKSEDEFVNNISQLFSDKSFAYFLAKNARKTIKEKFSSHIMLQKTLDYYSEIINK